MKEAAIKTSAVNLLLLFFTAGSDVAQGISAAVQKIAAPYLEDRGKFSLMLLVINIALSLFVVLLLTTRCGQHRSMLCYELRGGNRERVFWAQKRDLYQYFGMIAVGKVGTDVLFNAILGTVDGADMLCLELCFLLTGAMWLEAAYLVGLQAWSRGVGLFVPLVLVLFSNLIFPYVSTLPVSERRISVKLKTHNNILFYEIMNPYTMEYLQQPRGKERGYGLRNVRKCVEKYKGFVNIKKDNGIFAITAHLNRISI